MKPGIGAIIAMLQVICSLSLLAACNQSPQSQQETVPLPVRATETNLQPAATPNPFQLAEPGPYFVGVREYQLVDESRNGRKIGIMVKYPALKQTDATGKVIVRDAVPDPSAAPYAVVITSPNSGGIIFRSHLASHGLAMVTVDYPALYDVDYWDVQTIDHPLDILFVLDRLAIAPPAGLEGVLDTNHVGVAGYSSDGDKALVLSGARIDPENFLSQCSAARADHPPSLDLFVGWVCTLAVKWDFFASHAGEAITRSDDGLWQPITDERIRAVMPMGAAGAWLFGERGLAEVDRPTFIIAGTRDDIIPYALEPAFIFEHLGTHDKYMVSLIGQGHMLVTSAKQVARINHFATAFFGYYLQGKSVYLEYFSEGFVSQFSDLAWGVYVER